MLVALPIGQVETLLLGFTPTHARGVYRIRIVAVEQQDDALVGVGIRRYRNAVNKEAYGRTVGVFFVDREQNRLLGSLRFPPRAMRQKAAFAVRPQVRVEGFDTFFRARL